MAPLLHRRPTIKDVAKAAGVTPSTVSQALNNKGCVREETRTKVLEAVKVLRYHPNSRAQHLRAGGMKFVALMSGMAPSVSTGQAQLGFLMEIAAGAASAALNRGLALVLVPPLPGDLAALNGLDIDCALVAEPSADDAQLDWLRERGLPTVTLGRHPTLTDQPHVELHSKATAALLLEHMWEQGARRIGLITARQRRNSYLETEEAYFEFCAAHDMEPGHGLADEIGGEISGQAAAAELFQRRPDLDGLLAIVDAFAVGALEAARARGLAVPRDLKIATRYDGLRARTADPPLTATNLHLPEVAALGVELLFSRLHGRDLLLSLHPPKPTLIPRRSTARPTRP